MACFLVPVGEAIVVTVVKKVLEKKERNALVKAGEAKVYNLVSKGALEAPAKGGLTWSHRLGWLNKLLWGGSFLLAIEHIWHGEVVPWPPFLTAMNNPADVGPMLHEIATFGTAMAVLVTLVWGVMVLVANRKTKSVSHKARAAVKAGL